jgi:sphingomyelin phosphodiesterase acid-like 3
LDAARKDHVNVWVMGHIPPGVDPYSTISGLKDVCGGAKPTIFLSSDALGETLSKYGDVIRLAIFGHTHMDELRLIVPEQGKDGAAGQAVPLKMVPSISPVDGNLPSFVVAQAETATGTLQDYRVIAASNDTGVDTKWAETYDYGKTYQQPDLSARAVGDLIAGFHADALAETAASNAYLKNYFVRDASLALKLFWPQYVCALENRTPETYRTCLCGGGK